MELIPFILGLVIFSGVALGLFATRDDLTSQAPLPELEPQPEVWHKDTAPVQALLAKLTQARIPHDFKESGAGWLLEFNGFKMQPVGSWVHLYAPVHHPFPQMILRDNRESRHQSEGRGDATGDPKFDQRFHLTCNTSLTGAVFNPSLRQNMMRHNLFECSSDKMATGGDLHPNALCDLLDFAHVLQSNDPKRVVFQNLKDSIDAVQRISLRRIYQNQLTHPQLEDLIKPFLINDHPLTKLLAAMILERLTPSLLEVSLASPQLEDNLIASIFAYLKTHPDPGLAQVLNQAVLKENLPMDRRLAILKGLCTDEHLELGPNFERIILKEEDASTQFFLVNALNHMAGPASAELLLDLLETNQYQDLNVAQEALLGIQQGGSAVMIPRLRHLDKQLQTKLKQHIEETIVFIQAGVTNGEPGILSLTQPTDQEGNLSLSTGDDKQGALSRGPDADGALSTATPQ